jgi:hypothetical protein
MPENELRAIEHHLAEFFGRYGAVATVVLQ